MQIFKKKVKRTFQTRFDEHVITIGDAEAFRIADDTNRDVVTVWTGLKVLEFHKKDAVTIVESMINELQEVLNHLKGSS